MSLYFPGKTVLCLLIVAFSLTCLSERSREDTQPDKPPYKMDVPVKPRLTGGHDFLLHLPANLSKNSGELVFSIYKMTQDQNNSGKKNLVPADEVSMRIMPPSTKTQNNLLCKVSVQVPNGLASTYFVIISTKEGDILGTKTFTPSAAR